MDYTAFILEKMNDIESGRFNPEHELEAILSALDVVLESANIQSALEAINFAEKVYVDQLNTALKVGKISPHHHFNAGYKLQTNNPFAELREIAYELNGGQQQW